MHWNVSKHGYEEKGQDPFDRSSARATVPSKMTYPPSQVLENANDDPISTNAHSAGVLSSAETKTMEPAPTTNAPNAKPVESTCQTKPVKLGTISQLNSSMATFFDNNPFWFD